MGLSGRMCPKRRGLKSRWPGVSSRNRAMTRCFRCVSGVLSVSRCMVPGLISSVLDTWRVHCAVPAPESGPPRSGSGWGGALEGAWALSWTGACAANASSRLIMRAGASSSGMKSALSEAAPVDGWNPRHLRSSLRGASGGNRASRPTTLKDCPPQSTHNLRKHERAHELSFPVPGNRGGHAGCRGNRTGAQSCLSGLGSPPGSWPERL